MKGGYCRKRPDTLLCDFTQKITQRNDPHIRIRLADRLFNGLPDVVIIASGNPKLHFSRLRISLDGGVGRMSSGSLRRWIQKERKVNPMMEVYKLHFQLRQDQPD